MGWTLLLSGVAVNISGVIAIKFGQSFGQSFLSVFGYAAYFIGFFILSLSFKQLDVGMAYALWSGLGSLLVLTVGIVFFQEVVTGPKMLFFGFIVVGVVGMSLAT